jgi:hypothetical protein
MEELNDKFNISCNGEFRDWYTGKGSEIKEVTSGRVCNLQRKDEKDIYILFLWLGNHNWKIKEEGGMTKRQL